MLSGKKINRQVLLELLTTEDSIEVTFIKATTRGTRVMTCTLRESNIPSNYTKAIGSIIDSPAQDLLPVWDIDQGEWRSFYITNIIYVRTAEDMKKSKKKD